VISSRFASRALLVLSVAATFLAIATAFGAAVSFGLGGIRVRASDPARALLIAAVAAWSGALVSRPGAVRQLAISLGTVGCSYLVALNFVRAYAQERAIGDAAFLELYTLHVTRGTWTLGPYSQFGWHHPGPMYFYLLAPLYAAGGFRFAAINVGATLINAISLATLLIIIARSGSRSVALWLPSVLGLYIVRLSPMFVSAWNPHVLVLPMALLIVLSAALSAGRLSLTPLTIIVGSFCLQTHVGLAAPVLSLWAFTFVTVTLFTYLGGIASNDARKWLNLAMWTCAACWLLPVAEELQNSPGNLTAILHFFDGSHPRRPLTDSVFVWAQMICGVFTNSLSMPSGKPLAIMPSGSLVTLAIGQCILLVVAAARRAHDSHRFLAALCVAGSLAEIVALWSVTQITTTIFDHHVFWISVIGSLNWAILMAVATEGLVVRFVKWSPQRFAPVLYPVFVIAVAYEPLRTLHIMERQAHTGRGIGQEIKASADAIASDLVNNAFTRAIIRSGNDAWAEHAGVVLELYKRRVPVAVDRESVFMFGRPLALNGKERVEYFVYRTSSYSREISHPTTDVVLHQADLTVTRRACTGPDVSRPCLNE
jgi:hypothetical protein